MFILNQVLQIVPDLVIWCIYHSFYKTDIMKQKYYIQISLDPLFFSVSPSLSSCQWFNYDSFPVCGP